MGAVPRTSSTSSRRRRPPALHFGQLNSWAAVGEAAGGPVAEGGGALEEGSGAPFGTVGALLAASLLGTGPGARCWASFFQTFPVLEEHVDEQDEVERRAEEEEVLEVDSGEDDRVDR